MSGPAARVQAQAKLNLYLRVFSREESGYHSIETVFHRIELADEIALRVEEEEVRTIDVSGPDVGPAESNLARRAAIAYQQAGGWPRGFTIELDKKIPVGGGLGGGSADGAAVLRMLDSLAPKPLGEKKMLAIAASLGADIPFLVSSAVMALAWGRGERLLRLNPLPQRDVLLAAPNFQVATADAYAWIDADRAADSASSRHDAVEPLLITAETLGSWPSVAALGTNDFIDSVAERHPRLRAVLKALNETGSFMSSMSGAGSTVFGIYDTPPDAIALHRFGDITTSSTRTADKVVQPIRTG
jgi:4-diphosphocytidyl-2-C-methyl-D-erythritol kinase